MNLKKSIVTLLALATAVSTFAGIEVRLERTEKIRMKSFRRGMYLNKVIEIPAGTIVEYAKKSALGLPVGTRFTNNYGEMRTSRSAWKRVLNIEIQKGSLRHLPKYERKSIRSTVRDINEFGAKNRRDDNNGYTAYYISKWSVKNAASQVGGNYNNGNGNYNNGGSVVIDAPTNHGGNTTVTTTTSNYGYQSCFQQKYDTWYTTNEDLKRRGQEKLVGGAIIGIFGALVGQNNEDAGNIIMAGGAILAGVGLVQMSNATSIHTTYGDVQCNTYYRPIRHRVRHNIDSMYCETTEYQSTSWDRTVYYYESNCQGTQYVRYSHDQWYF